MNVACPGCNASYFVDEGKIPAKGGRLTCRACGLRWEIFRPGTGEIRAVTAAAAAAAVSAPPVPSTPIAPPAPAPALPATTRSKATSPPPDPKVTCPKCGHAFVPAPATRAAAAASTGKKVILLVEDQRYFTELAREALGPGYRTISVATKDEALKVIAAEPPHLMILDLSLARGQDGRDLLRALPDKEFPVLIFTARDETELYGPAWEELKSLGADDVVHKGMNVGDELRRKVAEMIGTG